MRNMTFRHCFSAYELFDNFDKKQLKIKKDAFKKKYGFRSRQWICTSAFVYCCYLIILDIIENNATFVLPLFGGKRGYFNAKPVSGDDFKIAKKRGAFAGIDMLKSNFTGYRIVYTWDSKYGRKERPIFINKRLKNKFYENINNGKIYY